jgi:hypothetical protein
LLALEQFNFDGADQADRAIRSVDPTRPSPELLEARNLLLPAPPAGRGGSA